MLNTPFVRISFKKLNNLFNFRSFKETTLYLNFSLNKGTISSENNNNLIDLTGVYPPITTPFNVNSKIDFDKLTSNLKLWENIPFRGFVVFGSTGEFVYLSQDEKIKLIQHVKHVFSSNKLIIAGSGCESTDETIKMTNEMATAGASAALIVSPFFYKSRYSDDALYEHYIKIAEESKIPIILYSVPSNTSLDMSPSLIIRLSDHPNIIGLKDSGGDITKIGFIVHKTKDKAFQVLAGSAGFFYPALCVGCVGGVLALANVLGVHLCKLQQLVTNHEHLEAQKLQHRLIEPNLAVTKRYGIPGVKSAMDLLGYYGGPVRSPLQPLTLTDKLELEKIFKINGFI